MILNNSSYNIRIGLAYWNVRRSCRRICLLMLLIIGMLIGLGGCQSLGPQPPVPPSPTRPSPPPKDHEYTTSCLVESLSHIAKWYTGDVQNRQDLFALNPQLPHPNCIQQGTDILIPMELWAKTTERVPCPELYLHTVRCPGESLSIIAKWYTGDYRNWECLATINPQLADPNLIRLHDVIHIPTHIMQTQKPMPPEHVEACNRSSVQPNYTHRVIWEGESLAHIAKWHTGDIQNRQRLFDLNPHLPNPNCIKQGTEVLIPNDLIADPTKRQQPIPKPPPCAPY